MMIDDEGSGVDMNDESTNERDERMFSMMRG